MKVVMYFFRDRFFSKMFFNPSPEKLFLKVVKFGVLFVVTVVMWSALAGCAQLVEGVQLGGEVKPLVDVRAPMILAVGPGTCALTKEGDLYCWGGVNKTYVDENGKRKYSRDWKPVYKGETKSGKKIKFIYMETYRATSSIETHLVDFYSSDLTLLSEDGEVYRFTYDPGMFLEYDKKRFVEPLEPSPVEGKIKFVKISTSFLYGCGLTKEGKAYCWGNHRSLPAKGKSIFAGYTNVGKEGYVEISEYEDIPYPVPVEMEDGTDVRFTDIYIDCDSFLSYGRCTKSPTYGLGTDGSVYRWGEFDVFVFDRFENKEKGSFPSRMTREIYLKEMYDDGELKGDDFDLDPLPACSIYLKGIDKNSDEELLGNRRKWGYRGKGYTIRKEYRDISECEGGEDEFVQVSYGDGSYCGLTKDGKAYCWNKTSRFDTIYGREWRAYSLGYGSTNEQEDLIPVAPSEAGEELRFKQISVSYNAPGRTHACAVTFEGKFYCWGSNITGGLGLGEDFEGESVTVDKYNKKKDKKEKKVIVSKIQLVPKEVKVGK